MPRARTLRASAATLLYTSKAPWWFHLHGPKHRGTKDTLVHCGLRPSPRFPLVAMAWDFSPTAAMQALLKNWEARRKPPTEKWDGQSGGVDKMNPTPIRMGWIAKAFLVATYSADDDAEPIMSILDSLHLPVLAAVPQQLKASRIRRSFFSHATERVAANGN